MEKRYFLHRISHCDYASYPLLKEGYLTIGFSDFSRQDFIDNVRVNKNWKDSWDYLESEFEAEWGETPRNRHTLWRFVEGMHKDDVILVPKGDVFSVYRIIGDAPHVISDLPVEGISDWWGNELSIENGMLWSAKMKEIDLGFYWKVEPIAKNIPRYKYADKKLTARMKVRLTNVLITDLKEHVEAAVQAHKDNAPINIGVDIIEGTTPTILKLIKDKLTPRKFELLVKYYFDRVGATAVDIPPQNESDKKGDADVVAIFEGIKVIIYTQVKFHDGITDEWPVHQIVDYVDSKEGDGTDSSYTRVKWVVSTADKFSKEACRKALDNGVILINGSNFAKMLLEAGILNLSDTL